MYFSLPSFVSRSWVMMGQGHGPLVMGRGPLVIGGHWSWVIGHGPLVIVHRLSLIVIVFVLVLWSAWNSNTTSRANPNPNLHSGPNPYRRSLHHGYDTADICQEHIAFRGLQAFRGRPRFPGPSLIALPWAVAEQDRTRQDRIGADKKSTAQTRTTNHSMGNICQKNVTNLYSDEHSEVLVKVS